jgi:DNA-binding LacI/PurR family transcriptional regulator
MSSDVTGPEEPVVQRRPASIADVAQAAGVSVPTVSRVLTGAAKVSPQRRERVLHAIDELDYRPSETARALVRRRPTTIAVLTSETTIFGYSTTIRGVELAAREAGFGVAIAVIDGAEDEAVDRAVDAALRQPLAGVVVLKFDPAGVAALGAVPDWMPVVAVSGEPDDSVSQATLDETSAGRAITEYLLGLGHATVHHVSVPPSRAEDGRTTGWREALLASGAVVPPIISGTWDARSGVAVGRRIAERDDVTAVFCGNDEIAMGVMTGLADAGKRVPEDVSVVGFDDHPLAEIWRPSLTTVAQDFDDLGRRAFVLLQHQIDGEQGVATSSALPAIVMRSSAAPPRHEGARSGSVPA